MLKDVIPERQNARSQILLNKRNSEEPRHSQGSKSSRPALAKTPTSRPPGEDKVLFNTNLYYSNEEGRRASNLPFSPDGPLNISDSQNKRHKKSAHARRKNSKRQHSGLLNQSGNSLRLDSRPLDAMSNADSTRNDLARVERQFYADEDLLQMLHVQATIIEGGILSAQKPSPAQVGFIEL